MLTVIFFMEHYNMACREVYVSIVTLRMMSFSTTTKYSSMLKISSPAPMIRLAAIMPA